jgi:hypothetical protein
VSTLRITDNYVSFPSDPATRSMLYVSDVVGTSDTAVVVSGNYQYRGNTLVRLGSSSAQMATGRYEILNNYHNNASSTNTAIGVEFYNQPMPLYVVVRGNSFYNYERDTAAGDRIGVDCTYPVSHDCTVVVEDNLIYSFYIASATGLGVGVYFALGGATEGTIRVLNNRMLSLHADSDIAAGVRIYTTSASILRATISGNEIVDIGGSSNPTSAYGIFLGDVEGGVVANNRVHNVVTANALGSGACLFLDNCANMLVHHNQFTHGVGAAAAVWPLGGSNITVRGSTSNVDISNNYCSQYGYGTATRVTTNISVSSDLVSGLSIKNNRVVSVVDGGTEGIKVRYIATTGVFTDLDISGNTVTMWDTADVQWYGIYALVGTDSSGIRVCDNTIREGALGSLHQGIHVQGTASSNVRAVFIHGNSLHGYKTGAGATLRNGIVLRDCCMSSICNNYVDWNTSGVAVGTGIWFDRSAGGPYLGFLCTGNFVTPDGGVSDEISIDGNMRDGLLSSCIVGNSTTAGTYTTAITGWTYDTASIKLS